jgi:hypothetical protein
MKQDPCPVDFSRKYNLEIEPGKDFEIRENHWLPRKLSVRFIAFGKTLYCDCQLTILPDHEFLHIVQFNKFGVPRVAVHYMMHLIKNYFTTFNFAGAFANIPFEVEARQYEEAIKNQKIR